MVAFTATSSLFGACMTEATEPESPMGYHGVSRGGMCGKVFSSTNLNAAPIGIKVVRRNAAGELVDSILPVDSKTTVYHLKNQFMDGGWVGSGYRIEYKGEEIMRESVDKASGALITLAQVFEGVSEMPTIHLIADTSRSPLPSTTASPAAEESQLAASAE